MSARGFTLVELLVALFISAIMFALGYGAINQALSNRERLEEQQERLIEVQRAMRTMAQDFTQVVPRPIRQPIGGAGHQGAFVSGSGADGLVAFTRAGWANPAGVQRASLQRVRYVLADGTLSREYWPVLDAVQSVVPRRRTVIDGVTALQLRYTADGVNWEEEWPPAAVADEKTEWQCPLAVEVTLQLEDFGALVRLYEVAG